METIANKAIPAKDFRIYLQEEFLKRCNNNPRYSIRAFARSLDIEASNISQILRGKRVIGPKIFKRLTNKLNLSPEEVESFEIAKIDKGTNNRKISKKDHQKINYKQLTIDVFHVISDWYHYAILELPRLKTYEPEPKWIAKTLGISVGEVNLALERLERLEIIEIKEDGSWETVSLSNLPKNGYSDVAYRNLQKQLLKKGLDAIDKHPIGVRENTSLIVAIDEKRIPKVISKINSFLDNLDVEIEADKSRDQVYNLSVSFYPTTNIVNKKEKKDV